MEIGDKVRVDGMTGVVVALISEGKFSSTYRAEDWACLKVGVLVETVEAGLIHCPDSKDVEIDQISN